MDDMDTGSNASGNSGSENLKELSEEDVAFSPTPHEKSILSGGASSSSAFPLPSTSKMGLDGSPSSNAVGDNTSKDSSDIITEQLTTGTGSSTIGGINLSGESNKSSVAMSASPGTLGSSTTTPTFSSSSVVEMKQLDTFKSSEFKKNSNALSGGMPDMNRHDLGVSWMAGTPLPPSSILANGDRIQTSPTTTLLPPTPPTVSTNVKREPTEKFLREKSICLEHFHSWNEQDQIDFVEELLAGMCHYQHGTVNAFLKPMLQRDFITLLPKKGTIFDSVFIKDAQKD